MGLTNAGLTNIGLGAGFTKNFRVQYESSLPGQPNIIANANALLAVIENEFAVTTGWFNTPAGQFGTNNRQVVNLSLPDGQGASHSGVSAITMDAQGGNVNAADAAERVKMIFMNEWVEILMDLTNGKWKGDDSTGEGLSQFCGIVRFPAGHYSYYGSWVTTWLNTNPRQNWVDQTKGTDKDVPSFACALAFFFYLTSQLNYSIKDIIAAGFASTSNTLAGVYQALTGKSNGWASFIGLVNSYYPATSTYSFQGDDLFPVSNLSAFWAPNQVTCGYDDSTARIFVDKLVQAEVIINLKSGDPAILQVPATVTIPQGSLSTSVKVSAVAISGPFNPKFVTVTGSYAGATLQMVAEVVAPAIASITLSPSSVVAGTNAVGTVTLDRPSVLGDVAVDLFSDTGYATVPAQVHVPQNADSATFLVTVPKVVFPFPTVQTLIHGSYSGTSANATLTINPSVVVGIISSLTLFPTTVSGGVTSTGTVTLLSPVATDTHVALSAISAGLALPQSSSPDSAQVPASVTIYAGKTLATFPVTTKSQPNASGPTTVTIIATAVVHKYQMLTITQ
jgi:hypothetical protein